MSEHDLPPTGSLRFRLRSGLQFDTHIVHSQVLLLSKVADVPVVCQTHDRKVAMMGAAVEIGRAAARRTDRRGSDQGTRTCHMPVYRDCG